MRVFAYCAQMFAVATWKAAGVRPITCPPLSADSFFDVARLDGYDLLYFDLHGEPGAAEWIGDGGIVALTAAQVQRADLSAAVVFATNCYLGDDDSPMLDALLAAGARCVVAGAGPNLAGARTVYGAHLLGEAFRRLLSRGASPGWALGAAKLAVRVNAALGSAEHKRAAADTLGFRAFDARSIRERRGKHPAPTGSKAI
jgi:hypothetical protein